MSRIIVFTDLDGTLLDAATYSFEAAKEGLQALAEREIPLIVCSSKTRAEIEYFRQLLGNDHPFISENGGGIFIPKGYAGLELRSFGPDALDEKEYFVIRLGASYKALRQVIEALRAEGFRVRGFGDMSVDEVAGLTGLAPEIAEMAKQRDFDEPFLLEDGDRQALYRAIMRMGFGVTEGRFMHLIGGSDKGKAVSLLSGIMRKRFGRLQSIALGDAANDLPMLRMVEHPVLVQRPGGGYAAGIALPSLIRAEGIGPKGWNRVILNLLDSFDLSDEL